MGQGRTLADAALSRMGAAEVPVLVEADDLARTEQAVPAGDRRVPHLVGADRLRRCRAARSVGLCLRRADRRALRHRRPQDDRVLQGTELSVATVRDERPVAPLIAVVGSDGSGKSTLAAEILA